MAFRPARRVAGHWARTGFASSEGHPDPPLGFCLWRKIGHADNSHGSGPSTPGQQSGTSLKGSWLVNPRCCLDLERQRGAMEAWAPRDPEGPSRGAPVRATPQSLGFGLDGPLVIKPLSSHSWELTFAAIPAEKGRIWVSYLHPNIRGGLSFPTSHPLLRHMGSAVTWDMPRAFSSLNG